ncbi:uncharacterized protein LOC107037505 [Diachasma alloeum]|uniref:uncharacterized protein LOC107037505 n=1 Tax=Diachasma alloeum TaxID=454923 RepID=UPI0007381E23|nr:uncharacterized protein LOC107037505 [Diachasma alloeum]
MYLPLVIGILAVASASPVKYDQRQDGKLNLHAKLENLLLVVAPSSGSPSGSIDFDLPGILDQDLDFRRSGIQASNAEERRIEKLEEANVEDRKLEVLGEEAKFKRDELKLIGDAIENCGPGRYRDGVGICRADDSAKGKP